MDAEIRDAVKNQNVSAAENRSAAAESRIVATGNRSVIANANAAAAVKHFKNFHMIKRRLLCRHFTYKTKQIL